MLKRMPLITAVAVVAAMASGAVYDAFQPVAAKPSTTTEQGSKFTAEGPSTIQLSQISPTSGSSQGKVAVRGEDRIESKFTDQQVEAAQAAAEQQPVSSAIQDVTAPVGQKPVQLSGFDAINAGDCCTDSGFAATVPPDPDMAAGPNHLIVVVNITFQIFNKGGDPLTGPIPFADFFAGTKGCTAFSHGFAQVFDPDVVYDEANNRFVIGIDGGGDSYCVAATQTGDPTGAWNRYGFRTNILNAFFDFPHIGVGVDAIYMGSNQFGGGLPFGFEGRVWAMDKAAMYAGQSMTVVTHEAAPVGMEGRNNRRLDSTPQPMQLHGAFPPSGSKEYIMTEFFDGKTHSVYSWRDPFGADRFQLEGDVDLAAASGVPCENFSCFPVSWPQKGSPEILDGNDYRGQETEYRNGLLWTAQTLSCNPGQGTVNCVRWAQIDPTAVVPGTLNADGSLTSTTNGVVQAGVFGSAHEFRQFPSLAVDRCNDMAVGYSYSAASNGTGTEYPSIFVAGRGGSDPLGSIGGETRMVNGQVPYSSFQDNGGNRPERWGDYTGMTIAPDGKTFWYVGEYARQNTPNRFANWGTFVGSFQIAGCS